MIRPMHAAIVLITVGFAGCGGDLNDSAVIDTARGEVAEDPGRDVEATLSEWKIDVPSDTVNPGRYTFSVRNTGQYDHALEVEGNGKEWETDHIAPGQRGDLTVDLKPGVYEIYCPVKDARGEHEELGMKRRLVVREQG